MPLSAATITVNSSADDFDLGANGNCTLREAILAANGNVAVDACPAGQPGPGVVDHVVVPVGMYGLTIAGLEDDGEAGDLDLRDDVSIEGGGARQTIVDVGGLDRVVQVHGGVLATLSGITLRGGDTGGNGGGILNGGTLVVERCTIESNSAGGPGGGIRNDGQLTVRESTLRTNSTSDHGGGVDDHGTSTFVNSTVAGNSVGGGGAGGGLYNLGGTAMTIRSTTLVGNSAGAGPGLHIGGTVTVENVLIVGSCDGPVAATNGGNLESPGNTCGFVAASDQVNVANPMLGPLADNGGPTDTYLPLMGSPAIDGGETGLCETIDQRSSPRPVDGDGDGNADCDAGAVEVGGVTVFADGFESGDTGAWSSVIP